MEDRLEIGLSISHQNHSSGTLGAFVRDQNNRQGILSCNHVLAQNGRLFNSSSLDARRIFHPGNNGNLTTAQSKHIANVDRWRNTEKGIKCCDSAFAVLLENIKHSGNYVPLGRGYPFEGERIFLTSGRFVPQKGMKVYKIGQASGFTTGYFSFEAEELEIGDYKYGHVYGIEWMGYNEPFSVRGDSGSLVFTKVNNELQAFGMIFAGVSREGVATAKKTRERPYSIAISLRDALYNNKISYL